MFKQLEHDVAQNAQDMANEDRIDRIFKNHSAQLANHQELLAGLSTMLELVRRAQLAHQKIFEDLQKAVAEKTGNAEKTGKPPVEQVH